MKLLLSLFLLLSFCAVSSEAAPPYPIPKCEVGLEANRFQKIPPILILSKGENPNRPALALHLDGKLISEKENKEIWNAFRKVMDGAQDESISIDDLQNFYVDGVEIGVYFMREEDGKQTYVIQTEHQELRKQLLEYFQSILFFPKLEQIDEFRTKTGLSPIYFSAYVVEVDKAGKPKEPILASEELSKDLAYFLSGKRILDPIAGKPVQKKTFKLLATSGLQAEPNKFITFKYFADKNELPRKESHQLDMARRRLMLWLNKLEEKILK